MRKLTCRPQESNFVVALPISLYMRPPLDHLDPHGSVPVCVIVACRQQQMGLKEWIKPKSGQANHQKVQRFLSQYKSSHCWVMTIFIKFLVAPFHCNSNARKEGRQRDAS